MLNRRIVDGAAVGTVEHAIQKLRRGVVAKRSATGSAYVAVILALRRFDHETGSRLSRARHWINSKLEDADIDAPGGREVKRVFS
jgi:hypothetical protein